MICNNNINNFQQKEFTLLLSLLIIIFILQFSNRALRKLYLKDTYQ